MQFPEELNIQLEEKIDYRTKYNSETKKTFYAPVYENPEVATRLAQLDTEFTQLREQVSEMLQQPEWNQ